MGILDRMMSKGRSTTQDPSSTLVPVADAPVLERIKQVMKYVTNMQRGGEQAMPPIVNRLGVEMLDELRDQNPEIIELYIKQLAALIYWTGSGEVLDNFPMPPDFHPAIEPAVTVPVEPESVAE